jgi:hypothetical protein
MTDAATPSDHGDGQPTVEQAALAAEAAAVNGSAPAAEPAPASAAPPLAPVADERPELIVGAAFAGGLALALFLKRLAR